MKDLKNPATVTWLSTYLRRRSERQAAEAGELGLSQHQLRENQELADRIERIQTSVKRINELMKELRSQGYVESETDTSSASAGATEGAT